MERGIAYVFIIGTAAFGFLVGRLYQMAVRAWKDYKLAKNSVPILWRAFWAIVRGGLVLVLLAVVWLGASTWWAVTGGPEAKPTPSSSPR